MGSSNANFILGDGKEKDWKMSINPFTKAKHGKNSSGDKNVPKSVK